MNRPDVIVPPLSLPQTKNSAIIRRWNMWAARLRPGSIAVGLWLVFSIICINVVSHAQFSADLSAFLPRVPTPEQQLLIDQIKSGVASRLILIGIEGGTASARIQASKTLATRLRTNHDFLHITNGAVVSLENDRKLLFDNRYLFSQAVDAAHFNVSNLHAAVANSLELLSLTAGLFTKALLPHDPTGEVMGILDAMNTKQRPQTAGGVWVSRNGYRALLLARTRAAGTDTDGQERAINSIRAAFQAIATPGLHLVMTGPGPFSVTARSSIKGEVTWLSGLSTLIIISLLLSIYRSPLALMLGLLPVVSGILAGVAAVSLKFGTVHGITLGFGTALIGEAVDYSIYLFVQSRQLQPSHDSYATDLPPNFWSTIRIGVLTSIVGFAALLCSAFPGLAQLGLYAIAGLVTAVMVTRLVLPHLLPSTLRIRDLNAIGIYLHSWLVPLTYLRRPLLVLFLVALSILVTQRDRIWNTELAAISPIPAAAQALDATMRADLDVSNTRHIVVVTAADAQAALVGSERVGVQLAQLTQAGVIAGFESPAIYLPSMATQQRHIASLPGDTELRQRLQTAIVDLPLRIKTFEPFFADVAATRLRHPLQRADIDHTTLAQGVDALLFQANGQWIALLPLHITINSRSTQVNPQDVTTIRAAVAKTGLSGVYFIDIKGESNRLYAGYLHEAIQLSILGFVAISILLFAATRSIHSVLRIVTPLVIAVVIVMAGLVLLGQKLTLLHLVGMLLIVAIGSNYALFFERSITDGAIQPRTLASLLLANTTTVIGFGLLAFSSVPVLNAIGATVGPGAILALLFSAIWLCPKAIVLPPSLPKATNLT